MQGERRRRKVYWRRRRKKVWRRKVRSSMLLASAEELLSFYTHAQPHLRA
jgi:hypothetical protein